MRIDLSDMTQWDTPVFPVAVAAQAALVAPGTMRMWFQRERVNLHAMDAAFEPATDAKKRRLPRAAIPKTRGLPRLLTLRTVLTLAAAAALVRKGIDVTDAYQAAKEWTHIGEGWDGNGESPRDPACLFKEPAWTMLIHYAGAEARVVAVTHSETINFQYADLFAAGHPVPNAPTIVFLNMVDRYARGVCEGFLRP